MNDRSESARDPEPRVRSVTIYGAGVAGLTAAHEDSRWWWWSPSPIR